MSQTVPLVQPSVEDRLLASVRAIIREEFPQLAYMGLKQYVIQSVHGSGASATVDCTPTDTTLGLQSLARVPLLPLCGVTCEPEEGSICTVLFLNHSPALPRVVSVDGDPETVQIAPGGQSATSHAATIEGLVNLLVVIANANASLASAVPGPPIVSPTVDATVLSWLTRAATNPLTPTLFAAAGLLITNKIPDPTGLLPGIGTAALEVG